VPGRVELIQRALQPHAEHGLDLDSPAGHQELVKALERLHITAPSRRRDARRSPGPHHPIHILPGDLPDRLIEGGQYPLQPARRAVHRDLAKTPRHPGRRIRRGALSLEPLRISSDQQPRGRATLHHPKIPPHEPPSPQITRCRLTITVRTFKVNNRPEQHVAAGDGSIDTNEHVRISVDFAIGKRLTNLPALRQIGFSANRRLLRVQRISHDPIVGAQALTELTAPIITEAGARIPGLRFGDARVHALLQALLIHRLLPHGFTNRDLRTLIAPLLGKTPKDITAGMMTYDLRRLTAHGLIHRVPRTRRYQITDTGLQRALLFTHAHDHLLCTGLAEITNPDPPAPSRLRHAARAYQAAFDDLARYAHLAA
jgi:hypothetical protein